MNLIMLLLLFFAPPIIVAAIFAVPLRLPFGLMKEWSAKYKLYFGFRVALTIAGPLTLFLFQRAGGYDDMKASSYSPIGFSDRRSIFMFWGSIAAVVYTLISFFELSIMTGKQYFRCQKSRRSE